MTEGSLTRALEERIDILEAKVAELKPLARAWETYAGTLEANRQEKSISEVAKLLMLYPQRTLRTYLFSKGWITWKGGIITATQAGLESGILINRVYNGKDKAGDRVRVTAFGMAALAEYKICGDFERREIRPRVYGEKKPRSDYRYWNEGQRQGGFANV